MNNLENLWQYQQAELACEQLEQKLRATPNRQKFVKLHAFLTEQQNIISNLQKQINARQDALNVLTASFDELERKYDLELSELKIMENDEECTAAEMTESRRAIEGLIQQVEAARRDMFDTLSWIEKATAEYKETYQKAGRAKKEYDIAKTAFESEKSAAQPEIDIAKNKAAELRARCDPALLKKYDVVKSHHQVPMASVENNQCSGCRMSLPTMIVKRVLSGTGVNECESCGRILYNPNN